MDSKAVLDALAKMDAKLDALGAKLEDSTESIKLDIRGIKSEIERIHASVTQDLTADLASRAREHPQATLTEVSAG